MDEATKEALRKLKKQLEAMKIGETTDLTMPDGKIIRIQKESDYGREVKTNQVTEFDQYIEHEKDENDDRKHAWVSNESLREFLHIPDDEIIIPTPIPEPVEEE